MSLFDAVSVSATLVNPRTVVFEIDLRKPENNHLIEPQTLRVGMHEMMTKHLGINSWEARRNGPVIQIVVVGNINPEILTQAGY